MGDGEPSPVSHCLHGKVIIMPRKARVKSVTGIYHIMLRGINRQQIFFDEEDYLTFIHLLEYYKPICGYKIYAFCLMGNHIHILLGTEQASLESIFKRIGSAYVFWYNLKYARTGHLFQDRFKSEPVDSQQYFLTVLRYILQNPVKAGICSLPQDYKYSSARTYLSSGRGITDTDFALSLLNQSSLQMFILAPNDDSCLEIDESPRRGLTDASAEKLIIKEFGTLFPLKDANSDRCALNQSIPTLLSKGISIRQLSRITGISKKVIERAIAKSRCK